MIQASRRPRTRWEVCSTLKIEYFPEPSLEFGAGSHIDVRFGIATKGPLDMVSESAPSKIPIGIVGTNETIAGVRKWLERCRTEIPAKESRQPNLFTEFPGFNLDVAFKAELVFSDRLQYAISSKDFEKVCKHQEANDIVLGAAELLLGGVKHIAQNTNAGVILLALPLALLNAIAESNSNPKNRLDLRDLLKADCMAVRIPTQLVLPDTYDESKKVRLRKGADSFRRTQDEATRAWNFHSALYYKAGGTPWRLSSPEDALLTCYVGISFYRDSATDTLQTSVAQVFDERGRGVMVRGGTAVQSKGDRRPYLESGPAHDLISQALSLYKDFHKHAPARVVIHKSSPVRPSELEGISGALEEKGVEVSDVLWLGRSSFRLFRDGDYPPLRGTCVHASEKESVLYTCGSVEFYRTYPGMYLPSTLRLRLESVSQPRELLVAEILALTKMNWNNTQMDGLEPITLHAARRVGKVLRYLKAGQEPEPTYRFYM
jgi:hypothetical protein